MTVNIEIDAAEAHARAVVELDTLRQSARSGDEVDPALFAAAVANEELTAIAAERERADRQAEQASERHAAAEELLDSIGPVVSELDDRERDSLVAFIHAARALHQIVTERATTVSGMSRAVMNGVDRQAHGDRVNANVVGPVRVDGYDLTSNAEPVAVEVARAIHELIRPASSSVAEALQATGRYGNGMQRAKVSA